MSTFKVGAKVNNGWVFSYYARQEVCAARAARLMAAHMSATCRGWDELRVWDEAYAEVDDHDALILQVLPCDIGGWGSTANDGWLEERGRALAALIAQSSEVIAT